MWRWSIVIYPDYLFSDRERDGSIKIYYEDTDVLEEQIYLIFR